MVYKSKQIQKSGDNSNNIQTKSLTIVNGLDYSSVKKIALEIFKDNFLSLSKEAGDIATKRTEFLINSLLKRLQKEKLFLINEITEPGFQFSLFEAQKCYVKSGSIYKGELCIELLVDRLKNRKDLSQILLEESIRVISLLTEEHLDVITLIFLLSHSKEIKIKSKKDLLQYINKYIKPFIKNLCKQTTSFNSHLVYAGVAMPGGRINLINHFRSIFDNFDKLYLTKNDYAKRDKLFVFQKGKPEIAKFMRRKQWIDDCILKKISKINYKTINSLIKWQTSDLNNLSLTSVGIVVAAANFNRKSEASVDINQYIN